MRKTSRVLALILLCAMLLPGSWAFAASDTGDETEPPVEETVQDTGIIDAAAVKTMVENLLSEKDIDPKQVSIGYCYTATGDTWYYNGDKWFYSASMYKVPLIMLLAEKVSKGELTQDTAIYDSDVSQVEEHILTYSNNDWAHIIRKYLGGDAAWREAAKQYADLAEDDYDPDYLDYCYFNNRYMTSVMKTLYFERDRFPNVIECLLPAEPGSYFKMTLGDQYEIAQKYGSFEDSRGQKFNHTTGIVYTPNPCIITVMTSNVTAYEKFIADAGKLLTDYTLQLDSRLEDYEQQKEIEAQEEQRRQQEAEAEAQRQQQEQQRLAAEAEAQRQEEQRKAEAAQHREEIMGYVLKALVALAVIAVLVLVLRIVLKRRRLARYDDRPGRKSSRRAPASRQRSRQAEDEAYDSYDNNDVNENDDDYQQPRYEEQPPARKRRSGRNYTPKH